MTSTLSIILFIIIFFSLFFLSSIYPLFSFFHLLYFLSLLPSKKVTPPIDYNILHNFNTSFVCSFLSSFFCFIQPLFPLPSTTKEIVHLRISTFSYCIPLFLLSFLPSFLSLSLTFKANLTPNLDISLPLFSNSNPRIFSHQRRAQVATSHRRKREPFNFLSES